MSRVRIAAGEFDRSIDLLRDGPVADDGFTRRPGTPIVLATVFTRVRPAPGSERLASAQAAAEAPTVFTIRWSSDVADLNPKDAVRYGGRIYDIGAVTPLGRNDFLEIAATTRTDR